MKDDALTFFGLMAVGLMFAKVTVGLSFVLALFVWFVLVTGS